ARIGETANSGRSNVRRGLPSNAKRKRLISKEEIAMKIGRYAVTTTIALALSIVAASAALQSPINISGFEYLLGTSCTIDGQPATCGVRFGGWTGGRGQVANGWTPFPGDDQGLWKA